MEATIRSMAAETSSSKIASAAASSAAKEEEGEGAAAAIDDIGETGAVGNGEKVLTSGAPCGPAATSERLPNGADTGPSSKEGLELGEGAVLAFLGSPVEEETETNDTNSAPPAETLSLEAAFE